MLCSNYHAKQLTIATAWFVSEKYDGWRFIRKNGKFIGRSGKTIDVPGYIKNAVSHIPNEVTLDGELWLGYDKFQDIPTALETQAPGFQWLLFDVPSAPGDFDKRFTLLQELVGEGNQTVRVVPQMRVVSEKEVDALYNKLLENNSKAEGIILRPIDLQYKWNVRDDRFMKRKPVQDIEARVVAYHTTNAKKEIDGYVSSVVCTYIDDHTKVFNVAVKTTLPPPIGSVITVSYQNMTQGGLPRFPRFKGIRMIEDMPSTADVFVAPPAKTFTVNEIPEGALVYTIEEITGMEMPLQVKSGEKVYIRPSRGVKGYHCVTKAWNPATKPYCTCAAWKFQRMPAAKRTCKHTLAIFPELANA